MTRIHSWVFWRLYFKRIKALLPDFDDWLDKELEAFEYEWDNNMHKKDFYAELKGEADLRRPTGPLDRFTRRTS